MTPVACDTDAGPLPEGFAVELDPDAKPLHGGGWFGGSPSRVLRMTTAGAAAWQQLRTGPVPCRRAGLLARRLTDAGIAHPMPPPPPGRPDVMVAAASAPRRSGTSLAGRRRR